MYVAVARVICNLFSVQVVCVLLNSEYTDTTKRDALPLGIYFQEHVGSFIQPQEQTLEKRYALFSSAIQQLR